MLGHSGEDPLPPTAGPPLTAIDLASGTSSLLASCFIPALYLEHLLPGGGWVLFQDVMDDLWMVVGDSHSDAPGSR